MSIENSTLFAEKLDKSAPTPSTNDTCTAAAQNALQRLAENENNTPTSLPYCVIHCPVSVSKLILMPDFQRSVSVAVTVAVAVS